MLVVWLDVLLLTLAVYYAIGLLFAIPFVAFWVHRVDEAATGSPVAFRALILPGCAAFWPLLLRRLLRRDARIAPRGES